MRESTAALIAHGQRLLFVKRPPGGDLGECWELPGGKVDPGESREQGLARELDEELRLTATVGPVAGEARFEHRGVEFLLTGYWVATKDPEDLLPRLNLAEHVEAAFLHPSEAAALNLAPSDRSLLENVGLLEQG